LGSGTSCGRLIAGQHTHAGVRDTISTSTAYRKDHCVTITIIGIDCAVQDKRVGLARGFLDQGQPRVDQVVTGAQVECVVSSIAEWTQPKMPTLIALDAPLGWPVGLGKELHIHLAGTPLQTKPNEMFRRLTDRVIKERVGKQPLDVGADRIARTAHAALELLGKLRKRTGQTIPLAWSPNLDNSAWAIEVYPAATLEACGLLSSGYKGKDRLAARQKLLQELENYLTLPGDRTLMLENDDALDAAVCALAAADFLRGECIQPTDIELAHKEGWIWVRRPVSGGKEKISNGTS
jgi:predicted RNase H-like nuclease